MSRDLFVPDTTDERNPGADFNIKGTSNLREIFDKKFFSNR